MLAGVKKLLIITNPEDFNIFKKLLKDGKQLGIEISYEIQPKPEGIAQAFIIAEKFLEDDPSILILGDNLFYGDDLSRKLQKASLKEQGATLFGFQVNDPERYGVIEFSNNKNIINI